MYIKKIKINKFRNIDSLNISLNKGLNVFIGENNSGKTAVIDALRICMSWGNQAKSIFVKPEDLYIDRANHKYISQPIQFDLYFEIEKDIEGSIFYDLLSKVDDCLELQIHFKFWFEDKSDRKIFRFKVWGGDNEGQSISPEIFDLIRHVYLSALRDSNRDLQTNKNNKLGSLLEKIEPDAARQTQLAKKIDTILHKDQEWKIIRQNAKTKINEHLEGSSIKGKEIQVDLRFLDSEFRKIVGTLRVRIPIYSALSETNEEQKWFQIYQNGLGDNNKIYIASVLGDLIGLKGLENETYVALLIEEPEAHLHPQLQNVLFTYFSNLANNIQVFLTSHSPTITAKTRLDAISVFQNINNKITVLPLKDSQLNDDNKRHLHKFLDVTKAQLFFANGIILVEGISEALLMPIFAKIMGKEEENPHKYDLTKSGIEIVNVGGVSFESFAKLFNPENKDKRLSQKCVIITDSDPPDGGATSLSSRAQNVVKLKSGLLDVQLASDTFEKDLFEVSSDNARLMKDVYQDMHPRTTIDNSSDLLAKLKSNKDKGEFAQRLNSKLEDNSDGFTVPQYIKNAIEWVTLIETK